MKKTYVSVLSLLLVIVMLCTFASCGGKKNDNSDVPDNDKVDDGENTNPDGDTKDPLPGGEDDEPDYTPLADYLKAMSLSPYRIDPNVKEALGLSDPTVVGVDEDKYKNEELYPVPEDSFFGENIYPVWEYGITPNGEENAERLNSLILSLADVEGPKKIVFKPDVYLIEKTIKINNVEDLYICSANTAKNFEVRLRSWFQGFSISNNKNLHINNMDYDYVISPTVAGEIIATDPINKRVTLKIYDEFDLSHPPL